MTHDPKIDKKLSEKLSSYEVNVPEFSMKRNRWERLIYFLASPSKNPLERLTLSIRGITALGVFPLASAIMISAIQIVAFFI